MRTRLALLLTPAVLGLALLLPATTLAASGYTYKTVYNYCDGNTVHLKMKNTAAGSTSANKLTIESWAQRKRSGGWQTVFTWDPATYKFRVNGNAHTLTAWRSYNGTDQYYFRIVFRLSAWHNTSLLAQNTFASVRC